LNFRWWQSFGRLSMLFIFMIFLRNLTIRFRTSIFFPIHDFNRYRELLN
jgi:hypothetical protein